MNPFRAGTITFGRSAILTLIFCSFGGCDAGRPSPRVFSNAVELRKYLERGGDPNGMTKEEWYKGRRTLLHEAAIYGDEKIIKMLLAAGANPNRIDSEGRTPLMTVLATHEENPSRREIISCLLKVSDLAIKDEDGMSAYDYAKKYGAAAEIELVREAMESRF